MVEKKRPVIGVIGPGRCSGKIKKNAETIGQNIAEADATLVCGGLGGVMEAAAKGAKENNGITIGIIPSDQKDDANEYIDIVIPSGIGEARNLLIIRTADVVIALPGMFGTLSEMAFCMKTKTPLVSLQAWDISDKITRVKDPAEAVKEALKLVGSK
ncbi:MAG: TIGR00725 family protein [candidate division Zixibacteria bacterium]|nr:TIGR00725 family protein [candidate division Zixibacteria bacterium]